MRLRDRVHLSARRERQIVRALQAGIVLVLAAGLYYRNGGVVVNATVGLLVTLLPTVFRRNYAFTMDVGLVIWITVAMFLHAFGTLPLPGLDFVSLYQATWWWDHVTHALSSSLVAGAAYATVRAVGEHTDAIALPSQFLFAYLLVFVLAFGVVWELIEFYTAVVSALLGAEAVLTQYGLDDTILDLSYNTLGGLLVALFGTGYLTGVSDELASRLGTRTS